MKKTKWLSVLCAVALLCATAAGCNGASSSSEPPAPPASGAPAPNTEKTGEKVELRFSWWGSDERHQATLKVMELYMSKHPNVIVTGEYMGSDGYKDKLMTQLAGGTAPDIIQIDNPWLVDLQKQFDSFAGLSALGIDISGFDKDFVDDFGYVDGTLYALPTGVNGMATLLNTAVLDAAGVDYSKNWTWDDLVAAAKKVHAANPEQYFLNQDQSELAIYVLKSYIKQLTGEQLVKDDYTLGFSRDNLAQALGFIKRLFDEGVAEPASDAFLYKTKYYENPKWINNEIGAAFVHASTVTAREAGFADTADVMPMPVMDNAKESGLLVRPAQMLCINKNAASVEEAAKFLDFFFNDEEAALILKDTRSVPPTEKAQQLLLDKSLIDPLVVKAVNIAMANPGNPENSISGNLQLETIMVDTVEQAVMSGKSMEDVADGMISRFEQTLEELKKVLES